MPAESGGGCADLKARVHPFVIHFIPSAHLAPTVMMLFEFSPSRKKQNPVSVWDSPRRCGSRGRWSRCRTALEADGLFADTSHPLGCLAHQCVLANHPFLPTRQEAAY